MTPLGLAVLAFACWATPAPSVEVISGSSENAPRQPQVAVDDQGRIHLVFGQGSAIRYTLSTDRGKTFREPTTVGTLSSTPLGMRRGPRIAVTGPAVIVTAIEGGGYRATTGDIFAWRSPDDGKTWSQPARLNAVKTSAREGLHGMAGGPDGRVFVTWLDLRNGKTELWGAASQDAGATWATDRLVYQSPDRTICECCHPSAAYAPDGTLYLMWRNQIKGQRDLYLTSSRDNGTTFTPAQQLGDRSWTLAACPMDGGAVAVGADNRARTVWRRELAVIAAEPGRPERILGEGTQPWLAIGPDGAHVIWMAGSAAHRDPRPLRWLGPQSTRPETIAEVAVSPVLAAAPGGRGPVVAAWEEPGTSATTIRTLVLVPRTPSLP